MSFNGPVQSLLWQGNNNHNRIVSLLSLRCAPSKQARLLTLRCIPSLPDYNSLTVGSSSNSNALFKQQVSQTLLPFFAIFSSLATVQYIYICIRKLKKLIERNPDKSICGRCETADDVPTGECERWMVDIFFLS